MPQNYEIITFSEAAPLQCTMLRLGSVDAHLHDFFELDLVLSGTCQVTVSEQSYALGADDVLSIDAHTAHSFHGSDCTLITVQFDQRLFERTLPEPKHYDFFCNSAVQGDSAAFRQLRRLIAQLVKNNADQQQGYELRNWSLIYELMDVMYGNFRLAGSDARGQRAYRYAERVAQLVGIINENYQDDLPLSALAQRVHLSAPYLSKFFEKHFGVTYLAYLTRIRLSHAMQELLCTDDTIEVVSANSGFPNSHAFVQAFKREYGVLPSIYRRQKKNRSDTQETMSVRQHDYMAGLRKYLEHPSPDTPVQAITCHAGCSVTARQTPLRHSWRNVLAVTRAQAILFSDVQAMLRRIQAEVGFRYVKFNDIFSDEMRVYSENEAGEAVYSFAYVDKVFDFLRSVGLKPFVNLSFMPAQLAKTPRRLFNYLVSEPTSNERWAALVEALIRHLQERYGRQELRGWLFSVWHQPDTPESLYGFSSDEAFYHFYQASYQAVKGCDGDIPFGAPSSFYILDNDRTNWYRPFLQWCRENGCVPDFLNFHYYDTQPADSGADSSETFGFVMAMTLRDRPDGVSDFVSQVLAERRREFPKGIPIYLSEWNNTFSQQDLLNDTCFKSCYIIKSILDNYDKLDSFAYWSLTDWMGEAPQPRELFFGGLGLFTANGLPKASYYAFTLLRELGDVLLGKGEGWFITKKDNGYRILLYNYRHFSHLYALGERFDMTFTDRYTPFSPEQLLDVHLTLKDVSDGLYTVTETCINRRSGSAFDQWIAMGALELEKPTQLQNLAVRSVPTLSLYRTTAQNGTLELDAMLDMLEVRLLSIEPKTP